MDLRLVRLLLMHPVEPSLNLDKHLLEAKSFCLLQFYSSWFCKTQKISAKLKTKILQKSSSKVRNHSCTHVSRRHRTHRGPLWINQCRGVECLQEKMVFFHVCWSKLQKRTFWKRSSKRKGSRTITYYIWVSGEALLSSGEKPNH